MHSVLKFCRPKSVLIPYKRWRDDWRWAQGSSPLNTTSLRCFQQHKIIMGWATSLWILGGVCVSYSTVTGAIPSGSQPIAFHNAETKLQLEKMWSGDSSACPHMAQVASCCSMFLRMRVILQCILFMVRSTAKKFTAQMYARRTGTRGMAGPSELMICR